MRCYVNETSTPYLVRTIEIATNNGFNEGFFFHEVEQKKSIMKSEKIIIHEPIFLSTQATVQESAVTLPHIL